MKNTSLFILFAAVLSLPAPAVFATDYYVSASGRDRSAGTQSAPWKTIARVNRNTYHAGDRILFQGSQSFSGGLYFSPASVGTAASPIAVSSYGSGRATINAGGSYGLYAYDNGGFSVSSLNFVGGGQNANSSSGIFFYADYSGNVKLAHISIDSVEVSGFGHAGICIGAWNGATGYTDVRITNASAHDNRDGIQTYGAAKGALTALYIGHCAMYNNPGRSGDSNPTGSGITLGEVDGAVVERCEAYGNGALNTNAAGPVGIWAYDSNAVVIQNNESYGNKGGTGNDGDGFDFDGGVTNSVLQYNYAHDNDGAGFLLCQYAGASAQWGNTVRYNISQNDGRRNSYGALEVYSAVSSAEIYNNTVFVSPASSGQPRAVRLQNWSGTGLHLRNNILMTTGGLPLVDISGGGDLRFQGNDYWSGGASFSVLSGSASYSSVDAWRAATGQETLNGSAVGGSINPLLSNPGGGGTLGNADALATLNAYRLQAGSPLINNALSLGAYFSLATGAQDFFGDAIGNGGAVGAD